MVARTFGRSGWEVVVLARRQVAVPFARCVAWDGSTLGEWADELDGADVVLNLAGRSVDCRYNQENRRRIMDSRVVSTRLVGEAITRCRRPPTLWMNASTATIYRHALDRPMDEFNGELGGNEPGAPEKWNFSIDVAKAWERTLAEARTPHTRKVALRSAMTMSPDPGGVFSVLLRLTRLGLGGSIAGGHQYISWVHEMDFCHALKFIIDHHELTGEVNIASPNPIPQREFMRLLREAAGVFIGLPAAAWMVEIGAVFMRTESELILKSRRVIPGRLAHAGFQFTFPEWKLAAHELVDAARHDPYRKVQPDGTTGGVWK